MLNVLDRLFLIILSQFCIECLMILPLLNLIIGSLYISPALLIRISIFLFFFIIFLNLILKIYYLTDLIGKFVMIYIFFDKI